MTNKKILSTLSAVLLAIFLSVIIAVFAECPDKEMGSNGATPSSSKTGGDKGYEVVKISIEALKSNQQAYLNNFWTTLGFFAVALGWVLTSKDTKGFFCHKEKGETRKKRGNILVSVMFLIHLGVLTYTYTKSKKLLCVLEELNNKLADTYKLPHDLLVNYEIPWYWLPVDGAIIALLLLFIVYTIKEMEETS